MLQDTARWQQRPCLNQLSIEPSSRVPRLSLQNDHTQTHTRHTSIRICCSSSSSSSRTGGSSLRPRVSLPLATSVNAVFHRQRVVSRAWFGQHQPQRLWDYDGSCVKQLTLWELELLHRLSFGHRNQRSYLVVLYRPDSPACQAFEAEVERLASGLQHEPSFVAAALDVSSSEEATFVSNMLNVERVPSVLLYTEAARGCLKFLGPDMSAHGMLAAINKARKAAMPAAADSPGAADWQLIEAVVPLPVTALRAAAASGRTEAVLTTLQQQMQPIQTDPLVSQQVASAWTPGRGQFWGGVLLCSLLFLAWDLKLSDLWEDWCLSRRQAARLQGRKFTAQENLDDVVTYMMKSLSGSLPSLQKQQQQKEPADGQAPSAAADNKTDPDVSTASADQAQATAEVQASGLQQTASKQQLQSTTSLQQCDSGDANKSVAEAPASSRNA